MKTMRIGAITAIAVAFGVCTAAAQASRPQEHRGFWITFGAGGGLNLNKGLDGDRLGGGAGYVRLGGTPSQRVLLGFEAIGWGRDRSGATLARANFSFVAQYYPSERGGGFLKGGIGGSSISHTTTSGNTTTTTEQGGFGLTGGAGWDVRLGNNLYLTPNVDLLFQAFESRTDPVLGRIPGTNTLLLFTLGLTWH